MLPDSWRDARETILRPVPLVCFAAVAFFFAVSIVAENSWARAVAAIMLSVFTAGLAESVSSREAAIRRQRELEPQGRLAVRDLVLLGHLVSGVRTRGEEEARALDENPDDVQSARQYIRRLSDDCDTLERLVQQSILAWQDIVPGAADVVELDQLRARIPAAEAELDELRAQAAEHRVSEAQQKRLAARLRQQETELENLRQRAAAAEKRATERLLVRNGPVTIFTAGGIDPYTSSLHTSYFGTVETLPSSPPLLSLPLTPGHVRRDDGVVFEFDGKAASDYEMREGHPLTVGQRVNFFAFNIPGVSLIGAFGRAYDIRPAPTGAPPAPSG